MTNSHTDIAAFGAAGILLAITWIDRFLSTPSPLIQNLAYLAALSASAVGIYYKIKNRGRD